MSKRKHKIVFIILAAILVITMLASYVLPFTAFAESAARIELAETPGTDPGTGTDTGTGTDSETGTGGSETETPATETKPEPTPEPVMSLAVKGAPASMTVGDTVTLSYELKNAKDGVSVTWSTSDANVATIDASGTLKAVGAGNAEIIAVAGDVKDSVVVTVKDVSSEKISIVVIESGHTVKDGKLVIGRNDVIHLDVKLSPEGSKLPEGTAVRWNVGDSNIVDLSDKRELTPQDTGQTTITVTAGDLSDEIIVQVKEGGISTPLLILIIIVILGVIAGIILLVSYKKKKEAEEKLRRRRAAEERRRREMRIREEGRAEGTQEGYIRGYKEVERGSEGVDRSTKIYREPETDTKIYGQVVGVNDEDVPSSDGEEKPFELDDID